MRKLERERCSAKISKQLTFWIDVFSWEYCNSHRWEGFLLEPRAFSTFRVRGGSWGSPGTILELFWVALGIPWGLFGRLGSSLATVWGHFVLPLWDLGVPWAPSGCIWAAFFVTSGSHMGPKGQLLAYVGSYRVIVHDCLQAQFSLASLVFLGFTFSLLFMVSSLLVFLGPCSLCLRRFA